MKNYSLKTNKSKATEKFCAEIQKHRDWVPEAHIGTDKPVIQNLYFENLWSERYVPQNQNFNHSKSLIDLLFLLMIF